MSLGVGGIVSVGGSSGSGSGSGSGIQEINPGGNTGPTVTFQGVNGIQVTSPSPNVVLIDGASLSGTSTVSKFSALFVGITSGLFTHNFGTEDVIVQVQDNQVPRRVIHPDEIKIENSNQVSLLFNTPQDGKVVIV
jgi:hypothetical protein